MKKFLALFLVLAMLISSFAVLSSCTTKGGGPDNKENGEKETEKPTTNKEETKKDPLSTLLAAYANTSTDFFVIDNNAKEILNSNSKKAAATIKFTDSKNLIPEFDNLSYTYYADFENKFFATNQSLKLSDITTKAETYMDKNSMIIVNSALKNPLKVDFETLPSKLKTSAIFEMLGLNTEENKEIADLVVDIAEELKNALNSNEEDSLKLANEFLAIFMGDVTEEKIDNNGKKIDCVKMPLSLDKNSIESFIDKAVDCIPELADFEDFEEMKNQLFAQIDQALVGSKIELTVYISKEAVKLEKININVKIGSAIIGSDEAIKATGEIVFTDDKIALTGSTEIDNQTYSLNIEFAKTTKNDVTTFTLDGNFKLADDSKEATVKLFEGTATYNKKSGDIKLDVKVPQAETELSANGNFKVDGKKAIFSVTSASMKYATWEAPEISDEEFNDFIESADSDDYLSIEPTKVTKTESFEFNLELTLDTAPKAPSAPENAVDIMDLTKEELSNMTASDFLPV